MRRSRSRFADPHRRPQKPLEWPQEGAEYWRRRSRSPLSSRRAAKARQQYGGSLLTVQGTGQQDASLVAFELNMDIVDPRRHARRGKEGLRSLPAALADQGLERHTDEIFWLDSQEGQRWRICLNDL